MSSSGALIPRFRRARRDPELAVLEGFHALKHALRFDAPLLEVVVSEEAPLERLSSALAPDLSARLHELARPVEPAVFAQLAPLPPPTGVIALARRRAGEPAAMLADPRAAPVILLEDPRDLGNMGACVRVAAAADAAGVLSTGSHDPWHPDALRGAAGLHYALPVARLERLSLLDRGPAEGAGDGHAAGMPRSTGRCSRSTPTASRYSPGSCRRARCSRSAPSATASRTSSAPAPTRASASRCAPGSRASTSRPRSRPCCSPGGSPANAPLRRR